jgi:quinol monooxygenase YgiN
MIHVIATIEVVSGRREEFLQHLGANVPLVRAENGCLEYVPAVDVATTIAAQGSARPDVVTVLEKWADLESLEAHLIAPHMIVYRAKVKDLVQHVSLQVLQSV